MFVKDSTIAHNLYRHWHEDWLLRLSIDKVTDQPALGFANQQMGYVIKEINGIWNCQFIVNGLPYFSNAKVLHYYNTDSNKRNNNAFVFKNNDIYENIKNKGELSSEIIDYISKPFNAFYKEGRMRVVFADYTEFMDMNLIQILSRTYIKHPKLFKIADMLSCVYTWMKNYIMNNR